MAGPDEDLGRRALRARALRRIGAETLAVVASLALSSAPVRAQFVPFSPITLDIGTSIRSAAMAGAGAAVLWGEPDAWGNPATLSGLRGVSWVQGHSNLSPSFSNDLVFDSQQVLIGGAGIGASVMGQPFSGVGKARWDSGPITIGLPVGSETFSIFEKTESFALGISPLRLLDALRTSDGSGHARLSDVGEISVGYQTERTSGGFDTDSSGQTFDFGESYDWGLSGRLALGRLLWPEAAFQLDLAAADASLNNKRESPGSLSGTPTRFRKTGVALHGSPRPPAERTSPPPTLPWWRPADVPEFSATLAYDHDLRRDAAGTASAIDRAGLEAEVLRLLALRVGYVSDPRADIHAVSYGGGVTLPVGPWGSAGYQLAIEPLREGLKPRFRQGWSVWLDPARIWSDALGR